ncbi:phosphatase PAP2 family protein [Anaerobacillus alkaliphilus]|uniref:Phosphatase PAP2 family protein n=1 Tax=Anaerobacillus alkaliphilus TaxID=1548597 RepID=A0A4Q0VLX6_9BACI|nr:vanadium-dependent haloperoxidase [Anaerobacillus alkaliphilus]RXI96358.1 phosphatase PAP2 family protein [Anaerobacillus alkaliphilus]
MFFYLNGKGVDIVARNKKNCVYGPLNGRERKRKAYRLRRDMAWYHRLQPTIHHQCNEDESLYKNKIASFSKALPHNSLGEVELEAYDFFTKALKRGTPADFEAIPLGGDVKIANPQASYCYDLIGSDCHAQALPIPPTFSSAWQAGEMAELYWKALTRDINFEDYDNHPLTIEAAEELSNLSDFRGPKLNSAVTTGTLFRGDTPADLDGPYISQFLYKDIPFGSTIISQRYRTTLANADHMTSFDEWLNVQNGGSSTSSQKDDTSRYIRNGRDLAEYVHVDFSCQAPLSACLILNSWGRDALTETNPYLKSATQGGFVTFGSPHILDLVTKVTRLALEAAWFHKFLVHRKLRPEEFGGRVHNHVTKAKNYPIHSELLDSKVLSKIYDKYGTYLLPMSYPEGCPIHPAYPAGHATIAGAGVTVLKAFFNEGFIIPDAVRSSSDGLSLVPYSTTPLTIGGELNKLAANISLGRDFAGVHWRSDGIEGIKLGEAVAIEMLSDYKETYNEDFTGFTLTKFDGSEITIS